LLPEKPWFSSPQQWQETSALERVAPTNCQPFIVIMGNASFLVSPCYTEVCLDLIILLSFAEMTKSRGLRTVFLLPSQKILLMILTKAPGILFGISFMKMMKPDKITLRKPRRPSTSRFN